jgi:8-oxo-dGTP diphosphatase
MARTPIQAAGGIVVRSGSKPLIAVVQRRKDRGWVLPKGKLNRGESALAAARREVIEETGHDVVVHEFIGTISYKTRDAPKVVQFWRMEAVEAPPRPLMKDIRAVEWLPLSAAVKRLSLPREQLFLRNIGPLALSLARQTAPVHAAAGAPAPAVGKTEHVADESAPALGSFLDVFRIGLRQLRLLSRVRAARSDNAQSARD